MSQVKMTKLLKRLKEKEEKLKRERTRLKELKQKLNNEYKKKEASMLCAVGRTLLRTGTIVRDKQGNEIIAIELPVVLEALSRHSEVLEVGTLEKKYFPEIWLKKLYSWSKREGEREKEGVKE